MVENKEVKLPGAFLYRRTLTVFLKKLFYKDGTYLFIFLFIYLFIYSRSFKKTSIYNCFRKAD